MDWDKLRIFHAAAEAGSFTHAGETLRMSQSAVSRQVSALEKELKVALFHRHARGLVLTEQGELLFGTASEILSKLSTAETLLTDTTTKPTGDLRVTAPVGLGTVWITGRLRELGAQQGQTVTAGAEIATIDPGTEQIWEALRALYLVGQPEDIAAVLPYERELPDIPDHVRQQAAETEKAIRAREK